MLYRKIKLILFLLTTITNNFININSQAEPFLTTSCPPSLKVVSQNGAHQFHCENAEISAGWEKFVTHCLLSSCKSPPPLEWRSFIRSQKNIMGNDVAIKPKLVVQCPSFSWAANNYNNNTYDLPDVNGHYWRFDATIPSPLPPISPAESDWDKIEATLDPDNITVHFRCWNSRVPLGDGGWFIALRRDERDDNFTSCKLEDSTQTIPLKNNGVPVWTTHTQAKLICIKDHTHNP